MRRMAKKIIEYWLSLQGYDGEALQTTKLFFAFAEFYSNSGSFKGLKALQMLFYPLEQDLINSSS